MSGNYYAVTEVAGKPAGALLVGFAAVQPLIVSRAKPKFRVFASEACARRYLETGRYSQGGHRGRSNFGAKKMEPPV